MPDRSIIVDILAVLFGIGSWIGVSSTYLQLPIITNTAPEGWKLSSYVDLTVQSGNIGAVTYVLYQKFASKKLYDAYVIYVTMVIACIAAFGMAFFYDKTIEIFDKPRSVFLIGFTCLFSFVACLSSVVAMPFMGRFREIYLVSYLLGQGLNGFLSSILTLIQGVGESDEKCIPNNSTDSHVLTKSIPEPRFGPRTFFLFVFGMVVLSTIAFKLLNSLRICRNEYAEVSVNNGNYYQYDLSERNKDNYQNLPEDVRNLSRGNFIYLLVTDAVICFIGNGILPAIQPFSCLPYGNRAYHLSVTISLIANPICCFVAIFVPHFSIKWVRILTAVWFFNGSYIIFCALQSPQPPFVGLLTGELLIVS